MTHSNNCLHQFQPIAERIVDIQPFKTLQWFIRYDPDPGSIKTSRKVGQSINQQGRMRLSSSAKIIFDTEMDAKIIHLKPASATSCQIVRLRHFDQPKRITIEGTRLIFPT